MLYFLESLQAIIQLCVGAIALQSIMFWNCRVTRDLKSLLNRPICQFRSVNCALLLIEANAEPELGVQDVYWGVTSIRDKEEGNRIMRGKPSIHKAEPTLVKEKRVVRRTGQEQYRDAMQISERADKSNGELQEQSQPASQKNPAFGEMAR